jgi:hypothetical protein
MLGIDYEKSTTAAAKPTNHPAGALERNATAALPKPPMPEPLPLDPEPDCSTCVASPGANKTPTSLAAVALICSGVSMGLFRESHVGVLFVKGIELVTEMGTSNIV